MGYEFTLLCLVTGRFDSFGEFYSKVLTIRHCLRASHCHYLEYARYTIVEDAAQVKMLLIHKEQVRCSATMNLMHVVTQQVLHTMHVTSWHFVQLCALRYLSYALNTCKVLSNHVRRTC